MSVEGFGRIADGMKQDNGGEGRTRTYEGLASGFTVRPLCRSGHFSTSRCRVPSKHGSKESTYDGPTQALSTPIDR